MNAITLTHVEKTYSTGTQALKNVSFEVKAGSMTGLLGANGAGKTTLIGILTGLVRKTGGQILVAGINLDDQPELARSYIGVVPQEFNFSIFEKVEDILIDQAGYYGVPRKTARERADNLLHELGLWDKRTATARTLSGGMKRRLMIARALIHEPKILLLDEPSAGVDVELRRGMWEFIRKIHAQGTTILLTTHYLEEAEELCEQIVMMRQGEVVRNAPIQELLNELSAQSFVLTTDQLLTEGGIYNLKQKNATTWEASLKQGTSVTSMIQDFASHGVTIRDIRPKANRLEEVFIEAAM
ncbi:ABC transporter ATP-binding protein [Candidatus Uhrbacteria bacterium]|nr:ABC transporter ATP-binding protein [Candidatus Uhrbacteria bacterium]